MQVTIFKSEVLSEEELNCVSNVLKSSEISSIDSSFKLFEFEGSLSNRSAEEESSEASASRTSTIREI